MHLDSATCEKARLSRDARFDGRFFTGVITTGIYCRPVCPAPVPRPENVRYFQSAAAAAQAGLRPCLRCRPEASPGTPAWIGTSETVSRGLAMIEDGALDEGSVAELARKLGVTSRHLSRLFREHLGAPPVAVAQTRRLLFAKKLINETDLSMTDIAFSSGFGSVRRFNAVFQATYSRRPGDLRREPAANHQEIAEPAPPGEIVLRLPYRQPFDWNGLASFLATRAIPSVETVEPDRYRRAVSLPQGAGLIEVRPHATEHWLETRLLLPETGRLLHIVSRIRRLFDLSADPTEINAVLRPDPLLGRLVRKRPGLRVPGAFDGFELAVRAILGQQVTVKGATTLSGRLVERFGSPIEAPPAANIVATFPRPETLADADLESIGLPGIRASAIRRLAEATANGALDFEPAGNVEDSIARLTRLPGVGDWTAQYIAMRALAEPDAFPSSDLGLLKSAARDGAPLTPARLRRRAEVWRPWRAYAAMHLWSDSRSTRSIARTSKKNPKGDPR